MNATTNYLDDGNAEQAGVEVGNAELTTEAAAGESEVDAAAAAHAVVEADEFECSVSLMKLAIAETSSERWGMIWPPECTRF
jgi:hypothetical protein